LRAWDQGIWSDGILLSCSVPFFCSAPGGAEPEPFDGIVFVSRANQAAAFERISLSSLSWRFSRRSWLSSSRSAVVSPSPRRPASHSARPTQFLIDCAAGGFQVLRFTDWYLQTQHGKAIFTDAANCEASALSFLRFWPKPFGPGSQKTERRTR
jgi:hypothetical protein